MRKVAPVSSAEDLVSESAVSVERLIKSSSRVRDLGEVFTPASTVRAMLDQLPGEIWAAHPSPTFFEPCCGDGNFLVAIFDRKARVIAETLGSSGLAAGDDRGAFLFHLLEALSSIYGVDISADNVDGSHEHPLGARERMVLHFQRAVRRTLGRRLPKADGALRAARWIVWRNVQVGNLLPAAAESQGSPNDPDVPLLDYSWVAEEREVTVRSTVLADVLAAAESEAGTLSLFPPPEPVFVWRGKATQIHEAPVPAPAVKIDSARNGHGWRAA